MNFIENIKEKARQDIKTIILPESGDIRILKATEEIIKNDIARIILIGNTYEILEKAKQNGIILDGVRIIEPIYSDNFEKYVNSFYELRKHKGITIEDAIKLMNDPVFFGTMMVKLGDADGLVSGACHSTSDTLRPALQILKMSENSKLVSAFFFMVLKEPEFGENGVYVFSDCGLNFNPDADLLSEIAIESSRTFEKFIGKEAKVAMLSCSTHGSAHSPEIEKVANATKILKEKMPNLKVDGEVQLDAAIIEEVAKTKSPNSEINGHANVLIFPNLDSGNIGYKLVQRFAHAEAYGPICQGIAKPVNDLSRGCSIDDIVGVVAITAVQAQNK